MGYSLSWLAVRGIAFEVVLDRQGLVATPTRGDYAEHPVSAMPWGDWTLIVARGFDHRIVREPNLASLSVCCEVVACMVEEHVMFSVAEFWRDGHRIWSIEHDAQESLDHLSATGALPADYEAVKERLVAQQAAEGGAEADVDYFFDIPLIPAQFMTGFKHDMVKAAQTDGQFIVLVDTLRTEIKPKALWQFLG